MKSKELDSLINRGRVPPLLFLYTEETFVINEKVEMITNAVLKPGEIPKKAGNAYHRVNYLPHTRVYI